jgi:hypothetical protein
MDSGEDLKLQRMRSRWGKVILITFAPCGFAELGLRPILAGTLVA